MQNKFSSLFLSIQQLNILIEQIFKKGNPEGNKIRRYIKLKLKQFNLAQAYVPEEILTIAYERTLKRIENGKLIESKSLIAWLKSVSFNVIRELRKERDKENVNRRDIPTDEIATPYEAKENIPWEEHPSRVKYEKLIEYVRTLSPLEQELFQLRCEQSLPWKEVVHNLSEQDFKISSEAARKRFQRMRKNIVDMLL